MEITFTDQNFEAEVLKSEMPVLADFWAPWCGPCKLLGPIIEELAKEYADKIKIGKLNVDENQETAQKYNVMSVPTLLLIKGGEVKETLVGVQSKEALKEKLDSFI